MGSTLYSSSSRSLRSEEKGYSRVSYLNTASMDAVFTQNKERRIHESMSPKGVAFRESRDSAVHPNTVPVQFYLDVTGSMGMIPAEMIKEGLPTMMSTLIQGGVPDAAVMFGAVGDHETDRFPLQVAQFESGDAELDMWLTRTYLEKGGGANAGESYILGWFFAGYKVKTDAWEKRQKKGFVFTCGDEPPLLNLPATALQELTGDTFQQRSFSAKELLAKAQETNHVYHIHINHGSYALSGLWKDLLGQNVIETTDYTKVPQLISEIIMKYTEKTYNPLAEDALEGKTPDFGEGDKEVPHML